MIQKRSIAAAIVLTLVTCGLYSIYWYIVEVDDVNRVTQKENAMSGIVCLLLGIVTCGLFFLYMMYKLGDDLDNYLVSRGNAHASKGILYLVLAIFGLSIISMALIQNDLNTIADNYSGIDTSNYTNY